MTFLHDTGSVLWQILPHIALQVQKDTFIIQSVPKGPSRKRSGLFGKIRNTVKWRKLLQITWLQFQMLELFIYDTVAVLHYLYII
jgi:hypothetical protein